MWKKILIILGGVSLVGVIALAAIGVLWWTGTTNPVDAAEALSTPEALPDLLAGQGTKQGVRGEVTAVSGSKITVKTPQGASRDVETDAQTRFIHPGVASAKLSDIQVGDHLLAVGELKDTTFTASAVLVTPASYKRENLVGGKLTSVASDALKLQTRQGERTINVNASTQYFGAGLVPGASSDFKAGQFVAVIGQPGTSGQFTAEIVTQVPGQTVKRLIAARLLVQDRFIARIPRGQVASVDGSTITVKSPQGEKKIATDSATVFFKVPGYEKISLADIQPDNFIIVLGPVKDGTLTARVVLLVVKAPPAAQ
jgi:hypothetical protein